MARFHSVFGMKLKKPSATTRAKVLAAAHAVFLLVLLLHRHDHDAAKAAEPKCRNVGASSAHATLGSQVDGDLVTICLDAKFRKKLLQATKPRPIKVPPKTSQKPVAKPKPVTKPKLIIKPKPVVKPRPILHKSPPKPSPQSSQRNFGDRAVFRPTTSAIAVAPAANLKPMQAAKFSTVPKVSFGNAKLLGRPVVVRFVPLGLSWDFGDGAIFESKVTQPRVGHSFAAAGTYIVNLRTKFRVEYRLASGRWLADPDSINLASKPKTVQVGISGTNKHPKIVLLTTQ